jgi:hypothetical protein
MINEYADPDWIPLSKRIGASRADTLTPMQVIKYALQKYAFSANQNSDTMANEVCRVLTHRFANRFNYDTLCTPEVSNVR